LADSHRAQLATLEKGSPQYHYINQQLEQAEIRAKSFDSVVKSAGASAAITYSYSATASQTTFSGADLNSLTLAYTIGAEQVYLNGVLLVRTSDYTATDGTSVVLASGAVVNDTLLVVAYGTFTVADAYTKAESDALLQSLTIADIMDSY
jgi:hypothetical protein